MRSKWASLKPECQTESAGIQLIEKVNTILSIKMNKYLIKNFQGTLIKNGISPDTSFRGELCKYKRVLCKDQCSGRGNFGVNAALSLGFAGSSAPLWGFLWHQHPTGISQEWCGTSVFRTKSTVIFSCSPRQKEEHVAQSKLQERAKKKGKKCHIWASEMKETATTSTAREPRLSRSWGSADFTRVSRVGSLH